MKCGISRQRLGPILAPDQFGVARPLGQRIVTRHGVYPSFLAPSGVPWSENVRLQRNRSRSVSSYTVALDSDHARYITSRITQHARSMATGTRSLPTDSPVPYFQPLEGGHVSEGVPSDIGLPEGALHGSIQVPPQHANLDVFPYLPSSGIEYNPGVVEQDGLSTYTGLNNYDTLFEVRHGRGATDSVPKSDEGVLAASSIAMPTTTSSMDMTENLMIESRLKHAPDSKHLPTNQRGPISVREIPSTAEHRVVPPMSTGHILGEGAAIFTDMTETMLATLDQQMALSDEAEKPEGSLMSNLLTPGQISSHGDIRLRESKAITKSADNVEGKYPDMYLPVAENYKISDKFYGYTDSMSTDNNPMILVELTGLSYRYGTTIYAVD